ncbi:hypothetical protein IFT66_07880 [Rhizobium sp. CFBP 13726]|uniref:lysozyme inhibitor LprI family protein n=1 Tax=Rhizobium sp. CFBP 13726 TaxID=2775296 RepID=UPI00177C1EB6|nr:hypothetical protein [Rhizobium sp. CFBP 13726]MBD8650995.1 hypothetical protein [Rhizobium sp. CFBP 13726]
MKMSWAATVILAMLVAAGMSPAIVAVSASAASFDCRKAVSADERAICLNDELSALDDAMAAGFRQARKASPAAVKPLTRSLLSERNACGSDAECLKSAMTKAIGAYKSVILGEPVDAAGRDKNKIYYGSRAGMQVTVLSRTGLNTPNAVISVEHRREDAVAFCRDYVQNVTDKCIADELAIKLSDRFSGNCTTGRFTTISDQSYVFLGRNPSGAATMGSEFIVIDADTNQPLDGSMASGYPVALPQFQALCPARAR